MVSKWIMGAALALGLGLPAGAEPITGESLKEMLFSPSKMYLQVKDVKVFSLSTRSAVKSHLAQLRDASQMARLMAGGYGYYGAVAFPIKARGPISPTIGTQLNTPEAAEVFAKQSCEISYQSPCAVAALLLPIGYQERDLTLSQAVTQQVVDEWDSYPTPRFLAYSPTTSASGVSKGEGASARNSVEACQRPDCVVVVADTE